MSEDLERDRSSPELAAKVESFIDKKAAEAAL